MKVDDGTGQGPVDINPQVPEPIRVPPGSPHAPANSVPTTEGESQPQARDAAAAPSSLPPSLPSQPGPPSIPGPAAMSLRQQLPGPIMLNMFKLLVAYLLYEKREETPLQQAFWVLVEERHREFHNKEVKWTECKNKVCIEARALVEEGRKPEVLVTQLGAQLMGRYQVAFDPGDPGTPCLRAWLMDKEEAAKIQRVAPVQPVAVVAPDRPQPGQNRIILTDP